MPRRIYFCIITFLISLPLLAQKPEGLSRFELETPQTRIMQGNVIVITYTLDATNYEVKAHPTIEKCTPVDMQFEKSRTPEGLHRLTVSYVFKVGGQGPLKLSPMEVVVDSVTVIGPSCYLIAEANESFGHEWKTAKDFLISVGVPKENMNLKFKYETSTLMAFSDDDNLNFAIVAKEDYEPYLDTPVLAYGIGSIMWQSNGGSDSSTILRIFQQYDRQLEYLRSNNWVYQARRPSSYNPSPQGVSPILRGIDFGQEEPYNDLYPEAYTAEGKVKTVAGCGPVAMAQILYFHKDRNQPRGVGSITYPDGRARQVDLGKYKILYDGTKSDKAALTYCCAASVDATINPKSTSSSLVDFKSAFQVFWGYSPLCTYIANHYDFNMLAMLYKELDNGRPAIVADDSHIFICDGYKGDYLHLNFGWKGYCNGFYRALVVSRFAENQLFFREVLLGLEPGQQVRHKSVSVKKPGSLGRLLSEEEKKNVTNLTVSGRINGEDIAVIRNMAGAVYLNYYEKGGGSLSVLDLHDAKIEGSGIYLTKNARYMSFSGMVSNGMGVSHSYAFSIANMTDEKWDEIVSKGYDKNSSYILQRSDDGQYYISYFTKEDVIGSEMFSECMNLREITLPASTRKVERIAFDSCQSLLTVRNLPSDVAEDAFRGARLYEK